MLLFLVFVLEFKLLPMGWGMHSPVHHYQDLYITQFVWHLKHLRILALD